MYFFLFSADGSRRGEARRGEARRRHRFRRSSLSVSFVCVSWERCRMAANPDLTEVGSAALFAELQRRVGCLDKPEKRVILLGAYIPLRIKRE